MNAMKSFNIDNDLLNKIISVAYGDASLKDKLHIRRLAGNREEVKKLLEEYRAVAAEVHSLKEEDCPQTLIHNLPVKALRRKSLSMDLYSLIFSKPIFTAAVSAVLLAAVVFGIMNNKPIAYRHNYSQADVLLAERQAKQAFAIVGKIFNETSTTLKNEVIESKVAKPIGESLGIVNNLINKGEIK